MDVGAIGGSVLNTAFFGNGAADLNSMVGSAGDFSKTSASMMPDAFAGQGDVNLNALSSTTSHFGADGVRSVLSGLLERRSALPTSDSVAGHGGLNVKEITPGQGPSGAIDIPANAPKQDAGVDGYKAVMDYAIHAALVGQVVQGMTRAISTLTTKGG